MSQFIINGTALNGGAVAAAGGSIVVVSLPEDKAGKTVTITAPTGTVYKKTLTKSGDVAKAIFNGNIEVGTLIISCEEITDQIVVPYYGLYDVSAVGFSVEKWLTAGRIATSYESLEDVLADEKAVRQLMTIHASVDYLVDWLASDDEVAHTILDNDICAKWINLRDYALDMLYANPTVKAVMDEVDKYGYGEWALLPQVPTMTSNTAPYGNAICSSNTNDRPAWYAFKGLNNSDFWSSYGNGTNSWLGYKFVSPIIVKQVKVILESDRIRTYKIQASDDGSTWEDISDVIPATTGISTFELNNSLEHLYYRLFITSCGSTGEQYGAVVYALQFYAWGPKGAVPVMTSNTAPYGEAFASSAYTGYDAFKAFDNILSEEDRWAEGTNKASAGNVILGYKFKNPTMIRRLSVIAQRMTDGFLEASNDGSTWVKLGEGMNCNTGLTDRTYFDIQNDNYYMQYRLRMSSNDANYGVTVWHLQFYGRQLNVSVPTMTSNTAPWGEASASSEYGASYAAWTCFGNGLGWTSTTANAADSWVQYDFKKKIILKQVEIKPFWDDAKKTLSLKQYKIQGSNDGVNFVDLFENSVSNQAVSMLVNDIDSNKEYSIYRIQTVGATYHAEGRTHIEKLNFYGLDYSEREFEEGSTMKYIYDHGVELEEVVYYENGTCESAKCDGYYHIKSKTNLLCELYVKDKLDLTNYSRMRVVAGNDVSGRDTEVLALGAMTKVPSLFESSDRMAYSALPFSALPYNGNLDVSSVNSESYLVVGAGGNQAFGADLFEWWLE